MGATENVAIQNTAPLVYDIDLSLSIALMIYISNAMGEGRPMKAKNYAKVGYILFPLVALVLISILLAIKTPWAAFWTDDEKK